MRGFDKWLFGYGSPVAIGIYRILIGFWSFLTLVMIAPFFPRWYTERGFTPLSVSRDYLGPIDSHFSIFGRDFVLPFTLQRLNLLAHVTDPRLTGAFYALVMVASLFTMFGYLTRISSVALAIGLVSLHHRSPMILHGGDTVLRLAVLYIAIAPSGAACSLDRLIGLWKGRIPVEMPQVSLWPQRLIQINLALLYLTTVWLKWGGTLWRSGTATWYTARLHEFERFWYPEFLRNPPMIYITSYGTLLVELLLATLVFSKPFRKWVLLAGLLMHASIDWMMNVPLFGPITVTAYLCFYSGEEITDWAKRLGTRLKALRRIMRLPAGSALRPGPAAALAAADPFGLTEIATSGEKLLHIFWLPFRIPALLPFIPVLGRLRRSAISRKD